MSDPTTTPARTGRTSLLNATTKERIVSAVRSGAYLDDAASLAGVGRSTLFLWLAEGKNALEKQDNGEKLTDRDALCLDFLDAVESARAEAQLRNVMIIQKAANEGTWQAAAWYLERTNPRKWGRHETVEIGIPEERQVEPSDIAALLDQRIQRMRERSQGIIEAEASEIPDQEPPSLQIAR